MERNIDQKAYLAHASNLSENESRLTHEFAEWLPRNIIDCHAHCNLPTHVRSIDDRAFGHMLSTFPSFTVEESQEWKKRLYPGKYVQTLRFPNAFRGIDHRQANRYLLENSPADDRVALYGIPDDAQYTIAALAHPRVSALKMYYLYFEPPATEIYHYFPTCILEEAQGRNIPIILHPPKRITSCLEQILRLASDFPRLKICLAHLSLTKTMVPGIEDAFRALARQPLIHFDTALVPSMEVVSCALNAVGTERVMFGSDEPLHLIRSVAYQHPRLGERIVTLYSYHWTNGEEHQTFSNLADAAVHAHWLVLGAIKNAISAHSTQLQEVIKQQIFYTNARDFYGF
jgi:hypothetical protein